MAGRGEFGRKKRRAFDREAPRRLRQEAENEKDELARRAQLDSERERAELERRVQLEIEKERSVLEREAGSDGEG